ncbi:hypothetical protein B0A48_06169 [Cryoendolithus antarcticus]|uniref:Uncharacterized protein n=1 Tax=Cryoendolithus antarcticus TaxID=1507870 RepID=A0A1V8TAB0_9PEZI|nr:hypothetical protein B0A48_06169 [Cryoendolithus antarcticus]
MSGRGYAFAGTVAASAFAILTVYTSLGPELAKQAAERDGKRMEGFVVTGSGDTSTKKDSKDTIISRAIASDFMLAAEELKAPGKAGGFAWKLRERIWASGKPKDGVAAMTGDVKQQEMREEKT